MIILLHRLFDTYVRIFSLINIWFIHFSFNFQLFLVILPIRFYDLFRRVFADEKCVLWSQEIYYFLNVYSPSFTRMYNWRIDFMNLSLFFCHAWQFNELEVVSKQNK